MPISINFATKVITVPQDVCTFVSGTFYRLPTKTVFKVAVDDIMDGDDGMPFLHPIDHTTEYTVAGVTYAPKIEIVNGYSVEFTPNSQWSVELTESNNNLWDVGNGILVQNQVQVIPTNSGGLIGATTAVDIWTHVIENALTAEEIVRLLLASAAGKLSGANTTNIKIRDQADTKDRIDATVDALGNRSSITVDGT